MSPSQKPASSTRSSRRAPASKAQTQVAPKALTLTLADLQALITQVGREPIDELQLETGGIKLHVRKLGGAVPVAAAPPPAPAPAVPGPVQTLVVTAEPGPERIDDPSLHHITSPIVGTFYRSPSANAAAFVQPGDFVKPGQTLCIVEAMKLMNEIECDVAGEVVAVLVENGQPVEYGERMFAIKVR